MNALLQQRLQRKEQDIRRQNGSLLYETTESYSK